MGILPPTVFTMTPVNRCWVQANEELDIRLRLEIPRQVMSIDELVASNDINVSMLYQDIEKSRLR